MIGPKRARANPWLPIIGARWLLNPLPPRKKQKNRQPKTSGMGPKPLQTRRAARKGRKNSCNLRPINTLLHLQSPLLHFSFRLRLGTSLPSWKREREEGREGREASVSSGRPHPCLPPVTHHAPPSHQLPLLSPISFQDPTFFFPPHPFLLGSFIDLSLAPRRPFQLRRSHLGHLLRFPSSNRPKFSSNSSCFWPLSSNQSKNKRLGNKCPWLPPIPGLRFGRIRPNFIVFPLSRCAFPFSFLSQSGFHRVTPTAPPIGRRKKAAQKG